MNSAQLETNDSTLSQTPFDINVRKDLVWDFSDVPVDFDSSDIMVSYMWAALSAGAPPIERFFIKALKPLVDTIEDDPKLQQDVADMIAQEVQHSAAHIKLNKHLESIGYDIAGATAHYETVLAKMTEGLSPVDMLGVVAAGEHALYAIAQVYCGAPDIRARLHPQADRLFLYHFLEEAEHGAVSHDQYRYFVGNDYRHRIRMASRARHVFTMLNGAIEIFAAGFGHKVTVKNRLALLNYQWGNPGLLRKMTGRLLEYVSPRYRLNFDHEDMAKLKRWDKEVYAAQDS
ncbi:MAG: metal-dependent hydrolase [Oceanococcus sp.]